MYTPALPDMKSHVLCGKFKRKRLGMKEVLLGRMEDGDEGLPELKLMK